MLHNSVTSVSFHLEVHVNVISKNVHAEELAAADLTGVLLITVSQQMLVHVAPAGEHLCAHTHTHIYIEYMWSPVCVLLFDPLTQEIRNLVQITHLTTDGTR